MAEPEDARVLGWLEEEIAARRRTVAWLEGELAVRRDEIARFEAALEAELAGGVLSEPAV
jgi:hypothetical protein